MSNHPRRYPGSALRGLRSSLLLLFLLATATCCAGAAKRLVEEVVLQPTNDDLSQRNLSASSVTVKNQRGDNIHQSHQQYLKHERRQLAEIRHDEICHEDTLKTLPGENGVNLTTMAMGLVFSLENNSTQDVKISSFSAYLDTKLEFDFSIYQMDGFYLERGGSGSLLSTSLGTSLDGTGVWQMVARGENVTLADFTADKDGALLIPFSSFGGSGSVNVASDAVKSFYMRFTDSVMAVDEENAVGKDESEDMAAVTSTGYGGLKIYVGRVDIFSSPFVGNVTESILQNFYHPARFLGKIWSGLESCPPSLAPTSTPTTKTKSPSTVVTQSPVELASLISSQPPSRSPTTSPTHSPSREPSSSPSREPSTSPTSSPTTSPVKQPSVSPTSKTSSPTSSIKPSFSPSTSPSLSSMPTALSSARPSAQPSTSQAPSFTPSFTPSLLPSVPPSRHPSTAPSTFYNYLMVDDITYDVWYPPLDQDIVKKDIIRNITKYFQELFADPEDVLYPFVQSYNLGFCDTTEPSVDRIFTPGNVEVKCVKDDKLENYSNVCHRFRIQMCFQHSRDIPEGLVKGWLLHVTGRSEGNLQASYSGAKAVMSDQLIKFTNARPVEATARVEFCGVVEDQLIESSYLTNYTILSVTCDSFNFVPFNPSDIPISENVARPPFKARYRGLRRRLQTSEEILIGTLDVELTVTGKYTYANRVEDREREENFGDLVEDSINTDQGQKMVKTLQERQILAAGSTITGYEKVKTPAPAPATPVQSDELKPNSLHVVEESSSKETAGTAGIAAIVTASVVALLIAGFLVYNRMQRSKVNDELSRLSEGKEENDSSFFTEDPTNVAAVAQETRTEPTNSAAVAGRTGTAPVIDQNSTAENFAELEDSLTDESDVIPAYYNGTETNIFGEVIGSSTKWSANQRAHHNGDVLEQKDYQILSGEKIETHEDASRNGLINGIHSSNVASASMKNDQGSHRRSISLDQLDAFEICMIRKNQELQRDSLNSKRRSENSQGSGSSFEDRLRAKVNRGLTRERSSSLGAAVRSKQAVTLDDFEKRRQRKLEERQGRQKKRSVSPLNESPSTFSALESYEEKILKKMSSRGSEEASGAIDKQTPTLEDFEVLLQRKLSKGGGTQSVMTFEEKVSRKLSKDDSYVDRGSKRTSHGSVSSFEERLRAKAARGSLIRQRSSSLGAEVSKPGMKIDGSDTQLQRILEMQDSSQHSKNGVRQKKRSVSPRNKYPSSLSSLESYEERLLKKMSSKGSEEASGAIDKQTPTLEDFDALLQRKLGKGGGTQSIMTFEEKIHRKLSKDDSYVDRGPKRISPESASSFEERLRGKTARGSLNRQRSSSLGAEVSKPGKKIDGSNSQLQRILGVRDSSQHSKHGVSENRRKNLTTEDGCTSKGYNGDRLKKNHSLSKQRSSSLDTSTSESRRKLDDFEARLQRKLEARKRVNTSVVSPQNTERGRCHDSTLSPDDGEKMSFEASNFIRGRSTGTTHDKTTQRLEDFNARLQKKLEGGKSKSRRQRGSSLGDARSMSQRKLDDFDARLQKKLERKALQDD